jgi:hypothetical protein
MNAILIANKTLGIASQKSMLHDEALEHFHIMLQKAVYLSDYDQEMDAYDLIGTQYYYLNDMEKANYFHKKSIRGEYEKKTSNLRARNLSEKDRKNMEESPTGLQSKMLLEINGDTVGDKDGQIGAFSNLKGELIAKLQRHRTQYNQEDYNLMMKGLKYNNNEGLEAAKRYARAKEAAVKVMNLKKGFGLGITNMIRAKKHRVS